MIEKDRESVWKTVKIFFKKILLVFYIFLVEEESGVSGLMDAGSCIQYRVTGGGGGQAGPGGGGGEGGAGLAAYRVVTSSGDSASDTSNGSINTTPLSNVQVVVKINTTVVIIQQFLGSACKSNQWPILCYWKS